jgi:hypothetical protein
MQGRFSDPEEFRRTTGFDGFKLKPGVDFGAARKTQCRQERLVKRPYLG